MKQYKCPKCGMIFQEKLEKCPKCGATLNYPKEEVVEPEVIEAVDVEVVDETIIHVEAYQPSEQEQRNKSRTMTAFVLSIIGLFTALFPLSIASLCILGATDIPQRHPHRTFYRVAKPVGIVGCVLGPIIIGIIILVVVLAVRNAKEIKEMVDDLSNYIRLFNF